MGKQSSSKQPEPLVFFTDRDLGPTRGCEVVRILRDSGMLVEPFHDHFDDPLTAQNIANSQHVLSRIARRHSDPFIAALRMATDDERRRRKAGEVKMKLTMQEWLRRRGGPE